jgi:uncharacterized protein (DUF433 family)
MGGSGGQGRNRLAVQAPVCYVPRSEASERSQLTLRSTRVGIFSDCGYVASEQEDPTTRRSVPMNLMDRITVNPKQCGGRPCIRGMRIRVTDVLDLLASGLTREQVLEELPDLEPADVEACLRFASRRLDHPVVVA